MVIREVVEAVIAELENGKDGDAAIHGAMERLEVQRAAVKARSERIREKLGSKVLSLSDMADGFGFFYGQVKTADGVAALNVLPPQGLWAGDMLMPSREPDASHWLVYVDWQEVAKAENIEDLPALL